MVHWSVYLWIGGLCVCAAWCTYRYYLWARWMDKINADHFDYLKSPGRMIEGVNYFVAAGRTAFLLHHRYQYSEGRD